MNYSEALKYLAETSWFGKHPTLRNTRRILKQLGDPHKKYPIIQITGTNGKSSVVWTLSQILSAHGLRSAAYTSPHLNSYTERYQINSRPISKKDFCVCLAAVRLVCDRLLEAERKELGIFSRDKFEHSDEDSSIFRDDAPQSKRFKSSKLTEFTHFEILTATAFLYFWKQKVDVAVVEVGMGGRWDATSVSSPVVSVITNIALDHTDRLGTTKRKIAAEKAFIIKKGSLAVIGDIEGDALEPILQRIEKFGSPNLRLGNDITIKRAKTVKKRTIISVRTKSGIYRDLECSLLGDHQQKNMALAIVAAEAFIGRDSLIGRNSRYVESGAGQRRSGKENTNVGLSEDAVRSALLKVKAPGRMDVISDEGPIIMLDGAHNEAGVKNLIKEIKKYMVFKRLIIVAAILEDKNVKSMIRHLHSAADILIISKNYSYRAADPSEIAANLGSSPALIIEDDLRAAISKSKELARKKDLILITGSLYTVGHARYVLGSGPLEN